MRDPAKDQLARIDLADYRQQEHLAEAQEWDVEEFKRKHKLPRLPDEPISHPETDRQ